MDFKKTFQSVYETILKPLCIKYEKSYPLTYDDYNQILSLSNANFIKMDDKAMIQMIFLGWHIDGIVQLTEE